MLSSICIWPGLAEHIYYILCDIGNVRVRLRLRVYVCVSHMTTCSHFIRLLPYFVWYVDFSRHFVKVTVQNL